MSASYGAEQAEARDHAYALSHVFGGLFWLTALAGTAAYIEYNTNLTDEFDSAMPGWLSELKLNIDSLSTEEALLSGLGFVLLLGVLRWAGRSFERTGAEHSRNIGIEEDETHNANDHF